VISEPALRVEFFVSAESQNLGLRHAIRIGEFEGLAQLALAARATRHAGRRADDTYLCLPQINPDILMVKSTKHRPCFDSPVALNGPSLGRILA
jgi:hypothetical protein